CAAHLPAGCVEPRTGIHVLKTRMVKQIVKLEPQLQPPLLVLRERNVLENREVEYVDARTAEDVLRSISNAELRSRRRLNDIAVKVPQDVSLIFRKHGAPGKIHSRIDPGAAASDDIRAGNERVADAKGLAAGKCSPSCHFPIIED